MKNTSQNRSNNDLGNASKFLKDSSMSWLHYLANKKITLLERFLWFVVGACMVSLTAIIIYSLQDELFNHPTITSLERRDYPVDNIDFPGVAVCNVNMISKKRANAIAQKIANVTDKSTNEILRYIKMLGRLIDLKVDQNPQFLTAQETLQKYYEESYKMYTPYMMLNELQLPCGELMQKCYWLNKERNCSELFRMRVTYYGFCCTFNYHVQRVHHRIAYEKNVPQTVQQTLKVEGVGIDNGLTVYIDNDLEDYLYSSAPPTGVKVITFDSNDFPDMTSGGTTEIICSNGFESLLSVHPQRIYSTNALRYYSIKKRNCCFDDEFRTIYGEYSYSNCIVQCKVFSMLALCGCVPFQTPAPEIYPICSFEDIACLNKYTVKWNTLYPFDTLIEELSHEIEESLLCEECYNSCSDTIYQIGTNFTPLNNTNQTIIRLYFPSNYVYLYKQDVKFHWFEILSFIGGLLAIMLGCSFVTMVEVLKFVFERIVLLAIRQIKN